MFDSQFQKTKHFLATPLKPLVVVLAQCGILSVHAATPSDLHLVDPDANAGAQFGYSLSLHGDYLLVGAPNATTGGTAGGAAYIYKNTLGTWSLESRMTATPVAANANFGRSVSLSDNWVVMGAQYETSASTYSGATYVFDTGTWSQNARLVGSDLVFESVFGCSVSVYNDRILVGALGKNTGGSGSNFWSGRAYMYDYDSLSTSWTESIVYNPVQEPDDYFGTRVELRDGVAIISSSHGPGHPSPRNGEATTFQYTGSSWTFDEYLTSSPAPISGDSYGGANALSTDGQQCFIGAQLGSLGGNQGQVFVFDLSGSAWIQSQILTAPTPVAGDRFGSSISTEDNYLLVGAPRRDTAFTDLGSVLLYENGSGSWGFSEELVSSTSGLSAGFAIPDNSIDVTDEWAVVGAYGEGVNPGTVHFFKLDRVDPIPVVESIANPTSQSFFSGLELTFNEAVFDLQSTDFDCIGCTVTNLQGSGSSYTFDLTLNSEGSVTLSLPAGSVSDNVGNLNEASNTVVSIYDTVPPTSTADNVVDTTQVAGDITGSYAASDGGSGLASVDLYVKEPGGSWTNAGAVTGGAFAYTPSAGDGLYEFATVATDNATNSEIAPSGSDAGDVAVIYNDVEDSTFAYATIADGAYTFPMTDALDVVVTFSGGASGGPITVSRTTGDVAPTGYMAERLIDEMLSITGSFTGTAEVTWQYADASDDGLTGSLTSVFQFEGGVLVDVYTVTPSGTTLTIPGVTSFSDWYAGSNDADVAEWTLLDD